MLEACRKENVRKALPYGRGSLLLQRNRARQQVQDDPSAHHDSYKPINPRQEVARELLMDGGMTGVQTTNEFVAVAKGKLRMSWKDVLEALAAIRVLCAPPAPLTLETHNAALQIAERHGYHIFDSLVIAAALEAGCSVLYSEDMQDGQVIKGLTIRNPFLHG